MEDSISTPNQTHPTAVQNSVEQNNTTEPIKNDSDPIINVGGETYSENNIQNKLKQKNRDFGHMSNY